MASSVTTCLTPGTNFALQVWVCKVRGWFVLEGTSGWLFCSKWAISYVHTALEDLQGQRLHVALSSPSPVGSDRLLWSPPAISSPSPNSRCSSPYLSCWQPLPLLWFVDVLVVLEGSKLEAVILEVAWWERMGITLSPSPLAMLCCCSPRCCCQTLVLAHVCSGGKDPRAFHTELLPSQAVPLWYHCKKFILFLVIWEMESWVWMNVCFPEQNSTMMGRGRPKIILFIRAMCVGRRDSFLDCCMYTL